MRWGLNRDEQEDARGRKDSPGNIVKARLIVNITSFLNVTKRMQHSVCFSILA